MKFQCLTFERSYYHKIYEGGESDECIIYFE